MQFIACTTFSGVLFIRYFWSSLLEGQKLWCKHFPEAVMEDDLVCGVNWLPEIKKDSVMESQVQTATRAAQGKHPCAEVLHLIWFKLIIIHRR